MHRGRGISDIREANTLWFSQTLQETTHNQVMLITHMLHIGLKNSTVFYRHLAQNCVCVVPVVNASEAGSLSFCPLTDMTLTR